VFLMLHIIYIINSCFAHIINLAVQDALAALPQPSLFSLEEIEDQVLHDKLEQLETSNEYHEILESDLVKRVSEWVTELRASGRRREGFRKAIVDVNVMRAHRNKQPLPLLQLLRQINIRWSSTFSMIDRWLHMTPVWRGILGKLN
jgi:hypothetical protein